MYYNKEKSNSEIVISMKNVVKEYKVLNRRQGLKGSIADLFSKDYNIKRAVDDISIEVMRGEMVGYLGPNGAGKSTTIKLLTGILEPDYGTITVNGINPFNSRKEQAQNIGVVFGQRTQLWWALPVIESFNILKEIYKIEKKDFVQMLELYESLCEINNLLKIPVRQLSLGQRTLCDILAAFLHNPEIVFLDEPTIGIDVVMKSRIRNLILELNKKMNTTVILTTHDMGDVDALCNRVIIIDKGKKCFDNNISKLTTLVGSYRTLSVQFPDNYYSLSNECLEKMAENIINYLKDIFPKAKSVNSWVDESWVNVSFDENEIELMSIMKVIQEKFKISNIKIKDISTEDIVRKVYQGGISNESKAL